MKQANRRVSCRSTMGRGALCCLMLLTGCAFDVSHVKQQSIAFTSIAGAGWTFVLNHDVKATVGSGFATRLKAGSRWHQVGNTDRGAVFTTKDQIVTVEASNIYEAQLVVSENAITGFYLPIEKTFVVVASRIPIQTKTLETDQP